MLDIKEDATILYQGGSGGFFFYFYLLLTGKFISGDKLIYQSNNVLSSAMLRISKQFNRELSSNTKQWKSYETWPDNELCLKLNTDRQRLCLICNPLFNPDMFLHNSRIIEKTTPVLFYTDLDTQIRLAYDKQACWFTETSKQHYGFDGNIVKYIKMIKSNYSYLNNVKVDPEIPKIIETFRPTYFFNLRQVLDFDHNSAQRFLVDRWLSLESKKSLQKLGKSYD
jgi:hypothetical protein